MKTLSQLISCAKLTSSIDARRRARLKLHNYKLHALLQSRGSLRSACCRSPERADRRGVVMRRGYRFGPAPSSLRIARQAMVLTAATLAFSCARSAPNTPRAVTLQPLAVTARTIKPGETHSYRARVSAGAFLSVAVRQLGADVTLRLRETSGAFVAEANEPDIKYGTDRLSVVARTSGVIAIDITCTATAVDAHAYEIRLETKRHATEADRLVVRGDTAYYQGLLLAREQGGSSDRIRESLPVFKEALALYREARHRYGESRALAALAVAHGDLRSYKEAQPLLTAAIEIQTADGDRVGLSRSLQELAWQTLHQGELSKAVDIGKRAISVAVGAGLRDNEADSRNTVGWTFHQLADDAQAESELRHAVELFQAVRDPLGEGRARNNLGQVRDTQGDIRDAIVETERAIDLYRLARSPESEAQSLINLGHMYMRSGDPDRAVSSYLEANAIAERTKDRYLQASTLFSLGVAYGNRGDQNRDLELTLEAREIFREMGNRLWEAYTDSIDRSNLPSPGPISRSAGPVRASDHHTEGGGEPRFPSSDVLVRRPGLRGPRRDCQS